MGQPKRILILFAHPRVQGSIVQTAMLEAVSNLEHVTVHDLYSAYPDFMIDAKREQQLLLDHDIIILQHPFYWYSTPAIIKEWQDLVLENGWAYGVDGTRLNGKYLMNAVSTGGSPDAYHRNGRNRFEIVDLLRPFDQTAHLCGMAWLEPFVIFSGRHMEPGRLSGHAEQYRDIVAGLRDGRMNPLKRLASGHDLSERFLAANRLQAKEARHAS
ncbi:MAG: NAD(P)H-dependent oxidoreductase [Rhizobiaceae bacterium]